MPDHSGTAQAKAIACSFFELLNEGRVNDAMAVLDDTGSWWNVGPRTAVPMTTFKLSGREIMRMMPMRFVLHGVIAEGDTVLIETESISPKPGGGTYNNRYCYVLVVQDGRILHVREYPDTKYAAEMLPPEAWAYEKGSWEKHYGTYWHKD
ncbi:nuclear transport factor 2 family protein [Sphingobium tyrosinilyticum]|uniref:Nuclear transport factor 2 family protein n=1 Tax=Sphingobium tyrosinilyticum TaxID=2715436 RepID=A0ABV9F6F0_9SPHN